VKLIRQQNQGLSVARNTGINNAKGDYLIFLDSDDQLLPNSIKKLLRIAEKENPDIVIPDRFIKTFELDNRKEENLHFEEIGENISPIDFILEIMIGLGRAWSVCGVLYKSSIIRDNNILFPIGYTVEDVIFNLKYLDHSKSLSIVNEATLLYTQRAGSISKSLNKNLIETYLFIDEEIKKIFDKNCLDIQRSNNLRDSLLCRNAIALITSNMSSSNTDSFSEKRLFVKSMLENRRYNEAFKSNKRFTPYFTAPHIRIYFKLAYYLIKFAPELVVYLAWIAAYVQDKNSGQG
jgi:glycosyltransferase involved in cell wall biosynthesis